MAAWPNPRRRAAGVREGSRGAQFESRRSLLQCSTVERHAILGGKKPSMWPIKVIFSPKRSSRQRLFISGAQCFTLRLLRTVKKKYFDFLRGKIDLSNSLRLFSTEKDRGSKCCSVLLTNLFIAISRNIQGRARLLRIIASCRTGRHFRLKFTLFVEILDHRAWRMNTGETGNGSERK